MTRSQIVTSCHAQFTKSIQEICIIYLLNMIFQLGFRFCLLYIAKMRLAKIFKGLLTILVCFFTFSTVHHGGIGVVAKQDILRLLSICKEVPLDPQAESRISQVIISFLDVIQNEALGFLLRLKRTIFFGHDHLLGTILISLQRKDLATCHKTLVY